MSKGSSTDRTQYSWSRLLKAGALRRSTVSLRLRSWGITWMFHSPGGPTLVPVLGCSQSGSGASINWRKEGTSSPREQSAQRGSVTGRHVFLALGSCHCRICQSIPGLPPLFLPLRWHSRKDHIQTLLGVQCLGEWECQREDFWKAYLNIKFLSQCGVKAMGNHREGRRSSTILQRWTDLLNSVAPTAELKLNVKQKTE